MASQADIGTLACTILGKPPIASLFPPDPSDRAKELSAIYDVIRRGMLEGPGIWRFSVKRSSLAASTIVPASGPFTTQYAVPSDYLRLLQLGDMYAGLDLSDYRQGPTDADYSVEGGYFLCDYGSPLSIQYVADITDTTLFNPNFVIAFASILAWTTCERITGSDTKKKEALDRKAEALSNALASGALVNPPGYRGDDSWVLSRMQ
jgi:hypothetical protein